jgi:uncharacterized protein DUF3597
MGLFNTLMSKIFSHPAASAQSGGAQPAATTGAQSPGAQAPTSSPSSSPAAGIQAPAVATAPVRQVDVAAVLNAMAAKNPERLDWKHSIVDLMKLVGMDSSLAARKELAADLHYTGDQNDSATMNIWLHKQVLIKLSENGGKVPQELLKK